MKIKAGDLRAALKAAGSVTERRNTIPILGTVLVEVGGERASFTGTDLDIAVTATVPGSGGLAKLALGNHAGIAGMVKAGGGEMVEFVRTDGEKRDYGGWRVECGDMSASVTTIAADDFPLLGVPADRWTAMLAPEFLSVLRRVSIAVSNEETRFYLNGVYMHHVKDWTYALVATDGHRLVMAMVEIPDAPAPVDGIIIPKKTVRTLLALGGKVKQPFRMTVGRQAAPNEPQPLTDNGASRVQIDIDGDMPIRIVSKLIDGTFPDYTRVVPAAGKGEHRAIVQTADVRRAMAGFFGFVTEKTKALTLEFQRAGLRLSVNSPENGQASIVIPAEIVGGEFKIGFNGRYLLEMANATAGEKMLLECADPSAPTRITDPDAVDMVTVLMPMRVG